jgi:hypothetical protein
MQAATAERSVFLTALVPPHLKRKLETQARANDRSVSAELRLALRRHLEQR